MRTSQEQPWASAVLVATRSTSCWVVSRLASETARMVPSTIAVSGMTLVVVPASMWATVSTAGLKASTSRVSWVCRAVTVAQAAGMGSVQKCGVEACPPRPVTVSRNSSALASNGPGRVATSPLGMLGVTWRANARSMPWSTPSSIITLAPW